MVENHSPVRGVVVMVAPRACTEACVGLQKAITCWLASLSLPPRSSSDQARNACRVQGQKHVEDCCIAIPWVSDQCACGPYSRPRHKQPMVLHLVPSGSSGLGYRPWAYPPVLAIEGATMEEHLTSLFTVHQVSGPANCRAHVGASARGPRWGSRLDIPHRRVHTQEHRA